MGLFYTVLFLLLGLTLATKVSYRDYKVYKITPNDAEALAALKQLADETTDFSPYEFWHGPSAVGHETTLMVAPQIRDNIESMVESLNMKSETMIEDLQEKIDAEKPMKRDGTLYSVDWTQYNTLEEINLWLESLEQEFPDFITILKPGKSHQGRNITGVKLDLQPNVQKKAVFMESNIHAREWITAATNTYILDQFLRSNNASISSLASKYTWYFFPVMNPDGYEYTHTSNRMWRKTRTRYNIFCYGADPNRNWGYQWMNGGASQNPCSDIYAGPHAFSEPSVAVMRDFITSIADNLVAYLDFHSFSQMLLLPYGHTTDHLDNYDEMVRIGRTAMDKLKGVYGTEYVVGNVAETIYIAAGSSMDWVKGTFKTPIAYTYELRDNGTHGFILPPDQILPTAEETLVSVISIFEEYEATQSANLAEN